MDEAKLRKAAKSGDAAQAMISGGPLEPFTFKEATEAVREEIMKRWETSKSSEERERIWITIHVLDKIVDRLGIIASNGNVAKGDLDQLLKK